MHEYSVEGYERRNVYWFIAALSVALSIPIGIIAQSAGGWWGVAVTPPSAFTIFGLVNLIFDQFIWRWRWLYALGIIPIPNLRGRWKGELSTSKNPTARFEVNLTITQTYTKIMLRLDSTTSFSMSHMAVFKRADPGRYFVRWEYFADATDPNELNVKFRHFGVTRLIVTAEKNDFRNNATASYYTEHDRDSTGTIALRFLGD